jgi:hypothetical protein
MKRRTLLALVAVAVVLFGLTLDSCKDCNSGKNRGKGKDPLGNGSSEDNLGNGGSTGSSDGRSSEDNLGSGSSTNNSGGKDKDPSGGGSSADNSKDPSGSGSSADNSNRSSTGNSNSGGSTDSSDTPPKGRGALTPEEQEELDGLKAELVAAANVIIMNGEDDAHKSSIVKIEKITCNYRMIDYHNGTTADEERWFYHLYMMCLYQKGWAKYLKKACDSMGGGLENDNKDKENANGQRAMAEGLERECRAAVAERKDDIWNKLEPLLEPAQKEWEDLVGKENKYREALQRFGII